MVAATAVAVMAEVGWVAGAKGEVVTAKEAEVKVKEAVAMEESRAVATEAEKVTAQ